MLFLTYSFMYLVSTQNIISVEVKFFLHVSFFIGLDSLFLCLHLPLVAATHNTTCLKRLL